ncbi:MAG: ABC transporter substrate-binding protein [Oscillospiraceae bacterium]|nr:ABC transporter substrate-binding protein [Oscillospiraceae bacterium]
MKKKLFAMLLAASMVFSMAACGSGSSSAASSAGSTGAPAAPASNAASAENTTTSSGDNVLKIGALINTTGWFASIDYNNQIEMETLCKYYNDQGGIDIGGTKYQLELVVEDGGSDAEGIRSAAQRLVDQGIQYVIETNDFWVEGAIDIFENAGVMNIMAQNNMNHNVMNADIKYSYSFSDACTSQYSTALDVIKDQYPEVKSVVYCCDDNGVNKEQAALIEDACKRVGLEYNDAFIVYDGETTDFSSIALKVINSGADAFIGNGTPDNIAGLLKEVRSAGSDMLCAAVITLSPGALIAGSGLNDLSGAFTFGSDIATPEHNTDTFNELYKLFVDTYGQDNAAAWNGACMDNLYNLLQLMQGAGSTDVEAVRSYFDSIDSIETLFGTGVKCGEETFGVAHLIAHPSHALKAENGQIVYMGTYDCVAP